MNDQSSTTERVSCGLTGQKYETLESRDGMLTLRVEITEARALLLALHKECAFEINTLVTAVDHGIEREDEDKPRFDMIWQFQSVSHADRIRIHSWAKSQEPVAPSIADLWSGATYGERECFDMFGVIFEGHESLKRLLMPEAYDHFPLRKDFPHQGIEPDRLYKAWDRERRQEEGGEA